MEQSNFSKSNFVELTEEEMQNVNGGIGPLGIGVLIVVVGIGIYNGYKDTGKK